MQKFAEVVDRIERVRKQFGLNKSRFSSSMGIKPQTYNNFIGKQASKPNLDLVIGLVSRYNVNPEWLLKGVGPVHLTSEEGGSGAQMPGIAPMATEFPSAGWSAPEPYTPAPMAAESREPSIERAIQLLKDQIVHLTHELAATRAENRTLIEALERLAKATASAP